LQRIKLASFLREKGKIFILDEPTDGLHLKDIDRLISLFDTMVEVGNTIILIEHNLEVLKSSDYVIELGPKGGDQGGRILFEGTPREMLNAAKSVTRQYLL
nr:excinuclease ABC subunit UvrA [Bacteroidales bacterium]